MKIKQIPVFFSEDEERLLSLDAEKACRRPKDHVRYIVLSSLGLINDGSPKSSKTADQTCEVSQAKQVSSGFAGIVNS